MPDNSYIYNAMKSIDFDMNNIDNTAHYKNKNGIYVPRVTDIINYFGDKEALINWSNSLGFKRLRYRDELDKASAIGSETHEAIESYLKTGVETTTYSIPFKGFLLWINRIRAGNRVEVLKIEEPLIGTYYGGTCDLLIKVNDKIFVVDYKTSNKVYAKHFIQLSAYRALLFELYGIVVDGVMILQLNKKFPEFREYPLDLSIPENYRFMEYAFSTFLSMVYTYYNIINTENIYNTLF